MLRVIEKPSEEHQDLHTTLDELLRRGALRMLHQALETEVEGASHGTATSAIPAAMRRSCATAKRRRGSW